MVLAQSHRSSSRIRTILNVALLLSLALAILTHTTTTSAQDPSTSNQDGTPAPIINTVPPKSGNFKVTDSPGILTEEQYKRFDFDIWRMWEDGLPAAIFIRYSNDANQASQDFADALRDQWDIESSPGADDGLVMVVTIRERFPQTAILSLSYGENAFPQGQMTIPVLNDILEREVLPRIRTGNVNDGLTYAVRRILYYAEYTAPFPAPLTGSQETLHSLALPVSLIAGLLLLALVALPTRFLPHPGKNQWLMFAGAGFLVVCAFMLAAAGRNAAASGIALIDLVLALVLFASTTWRNNRRFPPKRIRITRRAVRGHVHPYRRRRMRSA